MMQRRKLVFTKMNSLLPLSVFVLSLLIANSSFTKAQGSLPAFTYVGHKNGPNEWGHLCREYTECSKGVHQSPVNIVRSAVVRNKKLTPLTRGYRTANATLFDNGIYVEVAYEHEAGIIEIHGKQYTLKQMHWHSPSEHRVEGVQFPAELHLVHQAEDKSYAVVAILYKYGAPDPILSKMKAKVDELVKEVNEGHDHIHIPLGVFSLHQFKKGTRKYYRYVGSLTTPPCAEQLIWNILGKVRSISKQQLDSLKSPLHSEYKNNSRPVQPLNGRKIEMYEELKH